MVDNPKAPDLTPRTSKQERSGETGKSRRHSKGRKIVFGAVLAAAAAGIGVLLYATLSDASFFFLDVDEAVERRESLGSERFRIQGITIPDSIQRDADVQDFRTGERVSALTFSIAFNGETAHVVHRGDQADIFQDCLPVILEGRWVDTSQPRIERIFSDRYYFASSEMLVKHDNNYLPAENTEDRTEQYSAENPSRVDDAVSDEALDPLRRCPQT